MSKFRRLTLEESRDEFPLLNEEARKALKGGCKNVCEEAEKRGYFYCSEKEYESLEAIGRWEGGFVCGLGYVGATTNAYSGMAECIPHSTFYNFGGRCYSCYHEGHGHCQMHTGCYSEYCNPCYSDYIKNLGWCPAHAEYYTYGYCQNCLLYGSSYNTPNYYCPIHNYSSDPSYCIPCSFDSGSGNDYGNHYGSGSGSGSGSGGLPSTGGSGSGSGSGNTEHTLYTVGQVVSEMTDSSFTSEDKTKLRVTLIDFLETKAGDFLYDKIMKEDGSFKITFDIGNTVTNSVDGEEWKGPAAYHKEDNIISFRDSETIGLGYLGEEFTHAVQDYVYGDQMTTKNPNYEFEAKLISDIINGNYSNQKGFNDVKGYIGFIDNITTGTYTSSTIVDAYNEYYTQWNDPDGVKQKIEPGDSYYYDPAKGILFDPLLLKEIVGLYQKK